MNLPENNKKYFHKIITSLIRYSSDFKSKLQALFPEIYADIESASTNPNCTCVGKVEKKVLENKDKSLSLLENYISENNVTVQLENIINKDYKSETPENISGQMFMIENTPEKFKEFFNRPLSFKAFSTALDSNNNLYLYFL
jgi:hypothetical protein